MAVILAHAPPFRRAVLALLLAVAGFGAATIVFGLSTSFWLSLLMLAALDNISVVIRNSLVLLRTPDDMRGRISAVNNLFIGASNQLGGCESGLTAQLFGPVWSVVGGGLGAILVGSSSPSRGLKCAGCAAWAGRSIRRAGRPYPPAPFPALRSGISDRSGKGCLWARMARQDLLRFA